MLPNKVFRIKPNFTQKLLDHSQNLQGLLFASSLVASIKIYRTVILQKKLYTNGHKQVELHSAVNTKLYRRFFFGIAF